MIEPISPEDQFWKWFESNSKSLKNLKRSQRSLIERLHSELSKVSEGLTFEIGSNSSYGCDFVVSADGMTERFSSVLRLVGAAPSLPGWRIIAFRQPKGTNFTLEFESHKLSPNELWFTASSNAYVLDLTFYAKGLTSRNRDVMHGAILIALDSALGEFDVETKVGRIDLKPAPRNPLKAGLKAFHELPTVVRQWVPSISSLNVFLCHASEDKPAIRALYKQIVADGYQPWFDEENILPGQDWQREITKAVKRSDVVLVCLSSSSINKTGYVQKEIKEVLDVADLRPEDAIFVIPVRLEDCIVPDRLAKWQWVDLFERNGYRQLMVALRVRASTLRHR
jgi:TIR domain